MPVELYCFTKTKVWPEHEAIISQLMDHMIAVLSIFGLRPYQVASSKSGAPELLSEPVMASIRAIEQGPRPAEGAKA